VNPDSFFHVAIKVHDPEAASRFYRERLNGEVIDRGEPDGTGPTAVSYVALEVADKRVYLFDRAPYEAAGLVEELPYGFLHFGYVVDDVEAAWREVTETGVEPVMEPTEFGDLKVAFFVAPGEVRIEFIEELDGE
jgi:catechol 2,3-dioxygenase-like lactoylglutathione lyase family enzyme